MKIFKPHKLPAGDSSVTTTDLVVLSVTIAAIAFGLFATIEGFRGASRSPGIQDAAHIQE